MDPLMIGAIALTCLLGLIVLGVPIAFALTAVGTVGYLSLTGMEATVAMFGIIVWEHGSNFLLISVPMFVLMGQLVYHTGIANDLFETVYRWVGRLPGGLAVAAVGSCAGFGAVSGSSFATVTTMGSMIVPEMKRYRYDMRLATGSIASAGTLAILIPPSIVLVFYGIWTETSIGALFIAGIVPGLLLALGFSIAIMVMCAIKKDLGPPGSSFSWSQRFASLTKLMPVAIVFFIVLGGMYGGFFTPTEASGVGVAGVLLVSIVMGRLTLSGLKASLRETGIIGAMFFALLIGGTMMSRFFVQADVTETVISLILSTGVSPYLIMLLFVLMYLALGAVLDTLGMLVLTVPIVFPVVMSLGFDPVWFGIYLVIMAELGLITPPIGLNVYVLNSVVRDVPVTQMFVGTIPFLIACLCLIGLLLAFPEIALWLPSTME